MAIKHVQAALDMSRILSTDTHGKPQDELNITEYMVLIQLSDYAHRDTHECYPSYATIAHLIGRSRRSVITAIAKLESVGLLAKDEQTKSNNDSHAPNLYVLNYEYMVHLSKKTTKGAARFEAFNRAKIGESTPPKTSPEGGEKTGGVVKSFHQGGEIISPGVVKSFHPKKVIYKKANENTPPSPPEGGSAAADPAERFEAFRTAYPTGAEHIGKNTNGRRAQGVKKAREAFTRIVKTGVDPLAIIDGANRYRVQCEAAATPQRYVRHMTTWLNAAGWEDEYTATPGNLSKADQYRAMIGATVTMPGTISSWDWVNDKPTERPLSHEEALYLTATTGVQINAPMPPQKPVEACKELEGQSTIYDIEGV